MISLVATVRPATAALRAFDHAELSDGQLLVTVPQLGTVLVSELRNSLRVNIAVETEDAAARACAALVRTLGSEVAIAWSREQLLSLTR